MGSAHGCPVHGSATRTIIHHCFIYYYDREHIHDTLKAVIEDWNETGQAGPHCGYDLAMKEDVDEDDEPAYCMYSTAEYKRNKEFPYNNLPDEYTGGTGESCSSTIGLKRTDPPTHWNMRLSINAPHLVRDTVHELSHVFGMEHEHQSDDRDKYIQVFYDDLQDHENCCQKDKIQEPNLTEYDLCLSYKESAHCGCGRGEYINGVNINGETIKAGSKVFDYKSVLVYNSFDNGMRVCLDRFEDCPLACWKNPKDCSKGTDRVQNWRRAVSDLDFDRIKTTYPYKEPPK